MPKPFQGAVLALILLGGLSRGAGAQATFESAGERALGMAGAFVAVADDASSAHWNPAGLATGRPASMTFGWLRGDVGRGDAPVTTDARRVRGSFTAVGTWPLGVSFGTFDLTAIREGLDGELVTETLKTSQFGATILQTVAQGLVVGSTLRYVRGEVVTAPSGGGSVDDALSRTDDVDAERTGAFDFDVGVMADMQKVRVGLTLKNLRSPTFGDVAVRELTLPRQTRLGVAVLPTDGLTIAVDMDLETVDFVGDPHRMVAIGGEARLGGRLLARSGVRWSIEGARRLVAAAGLSVALRQEFWLDGHYTQGRGGDDREFGVAIRAGL
jgi:hypothetical protein